MSAHAMEFTVTPQHVRDFATHGFVKLEAFYDVVRDIAPIQRGIHQVIGQVMKRHGIADRRAPFDAARFDEGFGDLIRQDRAYGGEVYDAVKQIPAFLRLVANASNEAAFRALRAGSIPGVAAGGHGIRIDNPNEDKYRSPWHQEYPAQLRSLDGVVFWAPLVPITEEIGPVAICEGSHAEGPLAVYRDRGEAGQVGAYALRIRDEDAVLARYPQRSAVCQPGDLLLMDFLTVHASGINRSTRSRWTMQFRYFNFNEANGLRHGWKGSFAAGVDFSLVHPELHVDAP